MRIEDVSYRKLEEAVIIDRRRLCADDHHDVGVPVVKGQWWWPKFLVASRHQLHIIYINHVYLSTFIMIYR